MRIIVTGGAGFIGSAVCRLLIRKGNCKVLNLDKLTYAADLRSLNSISENPNYSFTKEDICNGPQIAKLFETFQPTAVIHLAAESHVDRSIDGPAEFMKTNILGTFSLLEAARAYFYGLNAVERSQFRFVHVSTDEVFGTLGSTDLFKENTPYAPNSPYAASKASSDHLVRAWHHTYELPVIICNCTNNYGPFQFPEKLIPLMIINSLLGKKLPIYGTGQNVRDWLHVEDHALALFTILAKGVVGESYNIGSRNERSNLDVARRIFGLVQDRIPISGFSNFEEASEFIADRPGHDWRYAIDPSKLAKTLDWQPVYDFDTGLMSTVNWYIENREWWEPIVEKKYPGNRLGTGKGDD